MATPYRSSKPYRDATPYRGTGAGPSTITGAAALIGTGSLLGSGPPIVEPAAAHLTGAGTAAATAVGTTPIVPNVYRKVSASDLLEMRVPIRYGEYRFDVLDAYGSKIGEVHPLRSAAPKIDNQADRSVKRTLTSFKLDPVELAEVDVMRDRIQPWFVLEDGSTWPLGVFMFTDARKPSRRWGYELDSSLSDQLTDFDQPLGAAHGYTAGSSIVTALRELSEAAGYPDPLIDSSAAVLGESVAWKATDTRLSAVTQLCQAGGFYTPYFDNWGRLRYQLTPTELTPHLTYGSGDRIIVDTAVESDDLLKLPNRFVAVDTSGTDSPVVGVYDVPDGLPQSAKNRGRVIIDIVEVRGIQPGHAGDVAAAQAARSFASSSYASFDAPPDPRHDTFTPVMYRGQVMVEQSWSLTCDPSALMSHELRGPLRGS